MASTSQPLLTGILTLIAVFISACTPAQQPRAVQNSPSGTNHAVVTKGSLTPVLSMESTVTSSVQYEITSPVDGRFTRNPSGYSVTDQTQQVHPILTRELDIDSTLLVPDGAIVARGLPIVRTTHTGFVMAATVGGANLLRMQSMPESARAQVAGGSEPFSCELLDNVPSASSNPQQRSLYCMIPKEQPVIAGLTGILAVKFPTLKDALLLPVEAVGGSIARGNVRIQENGSPTIRSIKLGPSDGINIVISEGLNEGDIVLLPSPTMLND